MPLLWWVGFACGALVGMVVGGWLAWELCEVKVRRAERDRDAMRRAARASAPVGRGG